MSAFLQHKLFNKIYMSATFSPKVSNVTKIENLASAIRIKDYWILKGSRVGTTSFDNLDM